MKAFLPKFIRSVLIVSVAMCCRMTGHGQTDNDASANESIVMGAIHPHLSNDGQTIVFSYQGAVWRMPSDGGVMTRLTSQPGFDVQPVLSPDGQWVAFFRTDEARHGVLTLIRTSDGEARPLLHVIRGRGRLQFDPNGNRLLGSFQNDSGGWSLRWLDLAEAQLGPLLGPTLGLNPFTLSVKGDRIFFVTNRDVANSHTEQEGNNGPQNTVWSMPAKGGEPSKLFVFPARIYDLEPSEDGRALYAVTDLGGVHYDVWSIPLDRPSAAERITFGQGDEDRVSASRDGNQLLFTDNRRGATSLKLRQLSSGIDRDLIVSHRDFGQPTNAVTLSIVDDKTGTPTTARIVVQRKDGKFHAPNDALYGVKHRKMHFYASGKAALELPNGHYHITANRGPEYRALHLDVELDAESERTIELRLKRWTDQPALGWYSGESHIHANYGRGYWYNSPQTMFAICAGEDLHVANLMVANSDGDGVFDREYFRGRPDNVSTNDTLLYWNEEFRSTIWGHMTLLNLKQLVEPIFTGFKHTTNPHDHITNVDIGNHTHEQGGHVNYTHPAHVVLDPYLSAYSAKAVPIDVALGTVDSIDVMGSNHEANMALWYRLLGCGFEIPASAGTDCFSNRIPATRPGDVRAFVNIEGEFSYEKWIANLKRGRTFVTNGMMLTFTADGKTLGETITLSEPGEVSVLGTVRSQFPLKLAELIFDGEVIATKDAGADTQTSINLELQIPLPRSGWLALRAYGEQHPDANPRQFAHTSPIYVTVAGHPIDSSKDAAYFVRWIDRLWQDVQQRGRINASRHGHVKAQIDKARAIYQKLVKWEETK